MAKEQSTGLSIHGGALRWTGLRGAKAGPPVVTESREVPLQLEAGEAAQIASLSEADSTTVTAQLRAMRGSVQGRTAVALSTAHVLMRSVELPAVDPAELKSMVELQADKFSPFPAESAVTSYEIVRQTETASRVIVATVQRKNVETVGGILSAAGIVPRRMDVETLCWWRLLTDAGAINSNGCRIVILKDKAVCDVIVTIDGIPMIIRGLGQTSGLSDEDLCSELEYTLTSLENEHGIGRTDSICVWHWDTEPGALLRKLKERFDCEVHASTFKNLPPLSEGLARRALEAPGTTVDLAVPEWETGLRMIRLRKRMVHASVAVAAAWVVVFGGFFALLWIDKRNVSKLEEKAATLLKDETEEAENRDLLQAAKQYADTRYSALSCLREVSRLKPAGVEFERFTYNKALQPFKRDKTKKNTRESARTNQVVIAGHAFEPNTILDFQSALQTPPKMFTKVAPGRTISAPGKATFTLTLDLPRNTDETP
ncbi:MAG: pilus assembly protein PilM [bacterium]